MDSISVLIKCEQELIIVEGECLTLHRPVKMILRNSKGFLQMCKMFTQAEQGNVMIAH